MKRIYLLSTFALMLCSVMIWSCSQEETENIGKVYRYSPEEISKLRSMAEEYGIPEVRFRTESDEKLPTLNEMEETFMNFAKIKLSLCRPLEIEDSMQNRVSYVSKRSVIESFPTLSETMQIKSNVDYGVLTWVVSWTQYYSENSNKYLTPNVSLSVKYTLSDQMTRLNYYVKTSNSEYSIRGTELYLTSTFKIGRGISDFDVSYSEWVHPGFRPY